MTTSERALAVALYGCGIVLCGLIAAASCLGSGCAAASNALSALAPYAGPAAELGRAFLESRKVPIPPGQCAGVPAPLTPDPGSAYVVCVAGHGWLDSAAESLRGVAALAGEDLDESQALCIPLPDPKNVDRVVAVVCRAPYTE